MSNLINTNNSNRTYTITGLVNDQIYRLRVAAVNAYGQGPFTQYVYATPSLFAVDNDFYNVELLMDMDQTVGGDIYYGNSSLLLGTPGLSPNDDEYSIQTKLLLHGDGISIVDSSLNPKSISRANNPYIVSDSRFGTGSIRFSGNDYLSIGSSNDFNVGTGNFTVELFIKFKSINSHNPICNSTNDINSANSGKWYINYAPSVGLYIGQHSSSNSATTPWSPVIDTWYHLAIVRDSGTIKIFIDGTEQTVSNSTILNNVNFDQSGFLVGRVTSLSGLDAQIDEFRFTKGVARNIVVPSAAYPNPTNPFRDLSSSSKNIIVIGQPSVWSYNEPPPSAPTNIIPSQPQSGSLRLDWSFIFPLVTDYIVQYSSDGGINWVTVNDGISTNSNVTINNLTDGFYIFRIAATNGFGQGPWSETVDITLPLPISVEYLAVAGGGGGGNDMGGGGGAGGLVTNVVGASSGGGAVAEPILFLENISTLNVVVGAGGSGAASGSGGVGTNGGNSSILLEGGDLYFDNVSLLMHMNGANASTVFKDSSASPKTLTANGGAQISTTQSKFGGASAIFDGNGDYLTVPTGSYINFGTGDFVIECWARVNDIDGNYGIFGWQANQAGSDPIVRLGIMSGIVEFAYRGGAFTSAPSLVSQSTINANQWYYITVSRANNVMRLYLDGALQQEHTPSNPATLDAPFAPNVGAIPFDGSSQWFFNGYIDELRITKGSSRGYTGSTISIPTSSFPDTGNLVTAIGGGFGASQHNGNSWNANNGGSGGGGSGGRQSSSSYGGLPGNGTAKQGYNGAGSGPTWYPGGGGGAGGAGIGNGSVRGHGGPGVLSSILGTAYYWAGGGGASGYSTTGGDGGIGGGGGGAVGTTVGGAGINNGSAGGGGGTNTNPNTPGGNGGTNTGGGGGGGSHYNSNNYGGSGGSGAVILRTPATATSTTGSPTITTDGLYNIYMFTGTGSITFPVTPTAPLPPKNIRFNQNGQGDLIIEWDAVAPVYNVTDYVIQYSSDGGNNWTTANDAVSSTTGAVISGLTNNNYIIRVAAVNSVGQGPYRAKATVFPLPQVEVQYLLVAGGGGGGFQVGGGGGAGGLLTGTTILDRNTQYNIVVGGGGVGGGTSQTTPALNGTNSTLSTIVAIGGGAGANHVRSAGGYNGAGQVGGSGGGGAGDDSNQSGPGGAGTPGQGSNGGSGLNSQGWAGGGGGGAGNAGGNATTNTGGLGGDGLPSTITGTSTYYAGGGGGCNSGSGGFRAGGQGGGGAGTGDNNNNPSERNGVAGKGGGGGGVRDTSGQGGNGGSGVVIIRTLSTATNTTGNPTINTDGSYNVYIFTATGSITF